MDLAPLAGVALFLGIFGFLAVAAWADGRKREREAFYRHELYSKMLENPTGAGVVREMIERQIQEEDKRRREDRANGMKLGGFITTAVGVTLGVFLYFIVPDAPVFLIALIPVAVGLVILAAYFAGSHRERPARE
jgi:Flp pilus assembly protein TadB